MSFGEQVGLHQWTNGCWSLSGLQVPLPTSSRLHSGKWPRMDHTHFVNISEDHRGEGLQIRDKHHSVGMEGTFCFTCF